VLAAIGALQRAGMRAFAGADDADVAAAGAIAIDRAIKLDFEADDIVHRPPPPRYSAETSVFALAIAAAISAYVAPRDR
jgi:hypothetical protein